MNTTERLLIYFNLNTGAFYSKWVKGRDYHVGDINQFNHLVLQEFAYDYKLKKYVSVEYLTPTVLEVKKNIYDRAIDFIIKLREKNKKNKK